MSEISKMQQPDRIWVNERNAQSEVRIAGVIIQLNATVFPNDEKLERTIIGHLIALGQIGQASETFRILCNYLYHDDFFFSKYSVMYKAMAMIVAREDEIDALSLITELRKRKSNTSNALIFVGGEKEIYDLANMIPQNTETHARAIVRLSLKRSTKLFVKALDKLSDDNDTEMEELALKIHDAYQDLNARVAMLTNNSQHNAEQELSRYIQKLIEEGQDPELKVGVPIWIKLLNDYLLGWRKNKLYIVAAGTGVGKTSFMISAAYEALRQGKRILFFTLEMPYNELYERLVSIASGIDGQRIQKRKLTDTDNYRLKQIMVQVDSWFENGAFIIEEMNMPTMFQIEGKLDSYRNQDIDLVCIDYIGIEMIKYATNPGAKNQYQRNPGATEHGNHLWTEMRRIKKAKPYPFLVGTQVNRSSTKSGNRPNKTDIANSALAENAADALLILHRESAVDVGVGIPGHADITLAKNRSGPSGSGTMIDLQFNESTTKFDNWEQAPVVGKKS